MTTDTIDQSNKCQILKLEKSFKELDPNHHASCEAFSSQVRSVDAMIAHTYQLVAFDAVRMENPSQAADEWRKFSDLCTVALNVLLGAKERFPHCGTPDVYNRTLEYWQMAQGLYRQNQADSECLKIPIPEQLFPRQN